MGETSDKSNPRIGNQDQKWDKATNEPPDELVARVHCSVEMEILGELQTSLASHAKFVICNCAIEVTFEEGRAHLGIETQRQWSDLAIECSTPLLFGLYSLVALFGRAMHPDGQIPVAQAAWYHKQTATFRDVLAAVRRHLWDQGTFSTSPTDLAAVLVHRSTLESLCRAVC